MTDEKKIKITENGPYVVTGKIPLEKELSITETLYPVKWEKGEKYPEKSTCLLCRCGKTSKEPYCDGSHTKALFNGKETASRTTYDEQAKTITGPGIDLKDAEKLCSGARFCDVGGGTWFLTEKSDHESAKAKVIQQSCDCPSGRLVAVDKSTGNPIEPDFDQSISITEDYPSKVKGPIWVKGGIPIESSDGTIYEIRNRVTLCRCGKSKNKPFCDGKHLEI